MSTLDQAPWWTPAGLDRRFNGTKLKYLRSQRGIKVEQLAEWAGLTVMEVWAIEAGTRNANSKEAELLIVGVTGRKEK